MYRVSSFIGTFAWALLAGMALATVWVNLDAASYYDAIEWRLIDVASDSLGRASLTLIDLTSAVLMPLFLFYLGKELWEALVLRRGSLRGRYSGVPLLALLGGLIGAAVIWVLLSAAFETAEEAVFAGGWAVPLGSDVVLTYLAGRALFGAGSPALHVLLLLTIGSNIVGLMLLGTAFPDQPQRLLWLLLPVVAFLAVWFWVGRQAHSDATEVQRRRSLQLWPYALAGLVSWAGILAAGLPPALGLLPIIPAMPHADRAFGLFAEAEEFLTDPLNRAAHLLVKPLIVVLFLFGLTRGGIDLGAAEPTTWITLAALWLGKPLGIVAGGLLLAPRLGLPMPRGLRKRDLMLIAGLAGMGFTIPALAIDATLPGGAMQEAARLGLAISLCAGPLLVLAARKWWR
ncbi:Na+/H+ antiporter NhaA [Rhodobacter ferrooxidans]|uniref:Putative Na(+)/H(+) antiporter NhaA homolog n=1 Tax=Rhodobacter ferrooxidans TaxID=371731 RepID=C8S0K6_9RHOB|nr:Na+/H+ antiporter NhaA [Rhodobacter sp. SW2]EEW25540.1 Na+/H+ antiporter NhaA [Rhodobacter sp. SW2]